MTPTEPQGQTQLSVASRARWIALAVVCAGSLMNVLDTTIVGTRSIEHFRDNLAAAAAGPLPDDVIDEARTRLTAAGSRPADS